MDELHAMARRCLRAGIDAAQPKTVIHDAVSVAGDTLTVGTETYDLSKFDELLVVGGGNAAGTVATTLETVLGDRLDGGVVVTDVPTNLSRVTQIEGTHPRPNEQAVEGTRQLRERLASATDRTLVLAAITGGASALLPSPAGDLTLDDLRATTDELLASGAHIGEINAVRKHLSATKGGRLAAEAAPATVAVLLFSDVVGDDPSVIGSGAFSPDTTTYATALDVVDRYDMTLPERVSTRLERGAAGECAETPVASDGAFASVSVHLLASNHTAAEAAMAEARAGGFDPLLLSTRVRGEAREAAKSAVAVGEEIVSTGNPIDPPAVVVTGGETTVTVRSGDPGTGGPNTEYALSSALELDTPNIAVAAVDTDGIDGHSSVAGASIDAETVTDETRQAAQAALDAHDAATFLEDADATIVTEPTGTNVNDLRVVVVSGE